MYRITGTASGSTTRRSAREKCNSNIRAIEIVKSDGTVDRSQDAERNTQDALAAYCGWGDSDVRALAFNWQGEPLPPLAGLLTRDEIDGARKSTINAHYTDPSVARAIWTVAMRLLGVTEQTFGSAAPRGATLKILEPSCGNGMFFGTCPDVVADAAQFVGVEMDPLTSQIAARLYPEIKVICSPFERATLPADYFDLVIGNVPFADVRVIDESLPRYLRQTLHDYFICKSLTLTRPGGIIALITSTGTLDKKGGQVRRWLVDRADLVGALRLPSDAFTEIAGTQVTTDVLFLQHRVGQRPDASREWTESTEHTAEVPAAWGNVEDLTAQLNAYYLTHPAMMLGTLCRDKIVGGRGDGRFGLKSRPDAGPLAAQMIAASEGFIASVGPVDPPVAQPMPSLTTQTEPRPAACPATNAALAIHRAVKALLSAESSGAEDEIRRLRRRLNTAYDMYHRQWGRLSLAESQPEHPLAHLRSDRRWPLLLSLEVGQGHAAHNGQAAHRQGTGHKAPIFTRRTLLSYVAPADTLTPQDALYRCLDTSGAVDLLRIAELSQVTPEEAADALRGVIFRTPSGEWQTADRYLSGDVVGKLRDAHAAAELDPTYAENVAALERVQPERVPPEQIHATLGAPWIPPGTVEYFAYSLFPGQTWGLHIAYVEPTATWTVTCTNPHIERSEENRSIVGAPRMYGLEILQDTLNLKIPVIYDEFEGVDGGTYRVKNEQESAAAQGKQVELRERWASWAWVDAERADSLANLYNARYNTMRPRTFCGAHLTFPGLASEMGGKPLTLQKHQVDGAARILSCGSGGGGAGVDSGSGEGTLLTWKVGSGKTLGAICGVVKRVQLGLSRRALFVVPKHTLPQWRAAFLSAYPGLADELIAATDDAFGPTNRKRFLSSIATGDARYALVTYEQFKSIPLSQETFQSHMGAEISDLRAHLDAAIAGSDEAKALKRAFKAREKTLLRFAARYEEAWARATATGDAPIMWDDLGVDLLVYDEAHYVKNDMFSTHMTNIAGLPRAESHRAFDARVKAHVTMHRGGVLIGLTGTPITNTLAEAWIMMRLFQPGTLRRLGLQHFDAWAATFAEPYVSVEMDSVGKFRTQTRLKFQNIPELLNILAEAWDRAETEE